jgi:hypothetical protein
MSCIVDLDDEGTWPPAVVALVDEYADRLRGTTEYTSDLDLDPEDERLMDAALRSNRLLVFHCTRLLPHEDDMIRTQGLRLTPELVRDRIDAAHSYRHISDEELHAFHGSHVFANREHRNRENGVDVIVGNWPFERMPHACNPLLSIWGGEAMYMSSRNIDEKRLKQLGRPSIVVAHLLFDPPERVASYSRTLLRPFVGMRLGIEHPGTQLKLRDPLRPEEIADIWHPSDPNYDRFPRLSKR